jgi:hypothetical protein
VLSRRVVTESDNSFLEYQQEAGDIPGPFALEGEMKVEDTERERAEKGNSKLSEHLITTHHFKGV